MKVLVTGGNGMLGRAVRRLAEGRADLEIFAPGRADVDLSDRAAVDACMASGGFDAVVHLAARVGGIQANIASPADFYLENTIINTNVIDSAHRHGIQTLINIGSSCMYPKDHGESLSEGDILAAPLEPTNEGYAISKIAAAKHCSYLSQQYGRDYRTLIPCNLYGPGDDFAPERSHLLAAVIKKISDAVEAGANEVEIWGDGTARREFLFVDDLAGYVLDCLDRVADLPDMLNVGAGTDETVNDYHRIAAEIIGYTGGFTHDLSRPVGMKRKLLDISLARQHKWRPSTPLGDGLAQTYAFYRNGLNE